MLVIATAVATFSAAFGTIVSFHIDGATGACIVLVQAAMFVLAMLFAPKHGLALEAPARGRAVTVGAGLGVLALARPADACRAAPTGASSAAAFRS